MSEQVKISTQMTTCGAACSWHPPALSPVADDDDDDDYVGL